MSPQAQGVSSRTMMQMKEDRVSGAHCARPRPSPRPAREHEPLSSGPEARGDVLQQLTSPRGRRLAHTYVSRPFAGRERAFYFRTLPSSRRPNTEMQNVLLSQSTYEYNYMCEYATKNVVSFRLVSHAVTGTILVKWIPLFVQKPLRREEEKGRSRTTTSVDPSPSAAQRVLLERTIDRHFRSDADGLRANRERARRWRAKGKQKKRKLTLTR